MERLRLRDAQTFPLWMRLDSSKWRLRQRVETAMHSVS